MVFSLYTFGVLVYIPKRGRCMPCFWSSSSGHLCHLLIGFTPWGLNLNAQFTFTLLAPSPNVALALEERGKFSGPAHPSFLLLRNRWSFFFFTRKTSAVFRTWAWNRDLGQHFSWTTEFNWKKLHNNKTIIAKGSSVVYFLGSPKLAKEALYQFVLWALWQAHADPGLYLSRGRP